MVAKAVGVAWARAVAGVLATVAVAREEAVARADMEQGHCSCMSNSRSRAVEVALYNNRSKGSAVAYVTTLTGAVAVVYVVA